MQNGTISTIDFLHRQEGIARNIGGTYHYEYFLKDHLGNTRVVFDDGSAVLQQTDYYPFGMEINRKISSPKIQYTYNGKEFQEELGQYDYGARFYDPVVGRWNVVDPLAEAYQDWSPYNYVANNPLKFIDPNGMWIDDYRMRYDGRLEHLRDTKDNFDVIYNADNTESIKVTKSKIVQDDKSTTLTFKNDLFSANNLYEFIAQNTGVEFAKIDGFYGYNMIENVSILTTSHQESTVSTIPKMIVGLSNSGFVGRSISHIHPSGVQVPSGYYSNIEGNPLSMMPLLKSEVKYKDGDAANARITQQWPGFRNTKFELYTPKHNTKTLYDGYKKAGIIPLR